MKKSGELIIDVRKLRKTFGGLVAVNDIDMVVKKGEVFGFLGPNGSGKTTTIRMLCGLLKPDSGEGHCMGYDILTDSYEIKKRVGYMTQNFSLYRELTIEENLNFMARVYDIPDRKKRVQEALEQLQLVERKSQLTGELSGGWKQRVALAACLLHNPDLLLLDEPTAGVDPLARREFWDHIHTLSEKGVTTLVSTHYMDEAERCTRIAYLAYGNMLVSGTVPEVIQKTKLKAWEISGEISTALLQQAKKIKGITQSTLANYKIHLCGFDESDIIAGLNQLQQHHAINWEPVKPNLEDAFISLVNQSNGDFS